MNDDAVERGFMLRAIPRFAKMIKPWRFRQSFWEAAEEMQNNSSSIKNFDCYINAILKYSNVSVDKMKQSAREAIEQDFAAQHKHFKPFPMARETLLKAHQQGHRLVIATNPVFPLTGVLTRLRYGNLSDIPFVYITNSEVMTRCKPKVAFYQELIEKLDLDPAKTVMIGNDPLKDLPAKEVGIATFLLDIPTLSPLDDKTKQDPRIDHYGTYEDFQHIYLNG